MQESSVPEAAYVATHQDRLAAVIEEEIAHLRQARPVLESRIARASHLLVTHLSDPRAGVIRVRIGADGPRFVVRSLSAGHSIYEIDVRSWRCSCPDAASRNAACKHSVASWILLRADERLGKCPVCIDGAVHNGHEEDDVEHHEQVSCQRCKGGGR